MYGEYRQLSNNLYELKFKNGIRIYYTEDEKTIVLLLTGGDKKSQSKDIKKAQEYIDDYIKRKNDEK